MRIRSLIFISFIFLLSLSLLVTFPSPSGVFPTDKVQATDNETTETTWIVKWKDQPRKDLPSTRWIEDVPSLNVSWIRPERGVDVEEWLEKIKDHNGVEYIQKNQEAQIQATPNDTDYRTQSYLPIIGAPAAWDIETENTDITIAIVDTGVDLNHSDLQGNLVNGINLLNRSASPMDDNGHGTRIAGVIGALGNNSRGVSGILWKTKIMPIKAVDRSGTGSEVKLAEGIRYAVDQGADIVVLSLGLYKYSPLMQETVNHAENNGVLLVAAAGNENKQVKYPAAYPTVLAVGGLDANKTVPTNSNYGPEIDLVAPWRVYTTILGNDYDYDTGTSMAAPQVAAAAGLLLKKHPRLKPFEIRAHLRGTAETIGTNSWDEKSGYGLLRVDRLLEQSLKKDYFEPNNQMNQSKRLPESTMLSGSLSSRSDQDWFVMQTPYRGDVILRFQTDRSQDLQRMKLTYRTSSQDNGVEFTDLSKAIRLPAGTNLRYVTLQQQGQGTGEIVYRVTSTFRMTPDSFEPNNRQYQSYVLPTRTQTITGNFHELGDEDWFSLNVETEGTLRVMTTTDSFRIDPALMVFRQGESAQTIDQNKWGEMETTSTLDVFPGKYYIRVTNAISEDAHPVTGEYKLNIEYHERLTDPNEPNNTMQQAMSMVMNREYRGMIRPTDDIDWFSFRIQNESYVELELSDVPTQRIMSLAVFDQRNNQIEITANSLGETTLKWNEVLDAGQYFVRLTANQSFASQLYRLKVNASTMVAGLRDISQHWARDSIVRFVEGGLASGYDDYSFRPQREITRAEAAVFLTRTFPRPTLSKQASLFSDVNEQHWAAQSIRLASRAEWISGYPNGTFRPQGQLTRVEMAVLMANVLGLDTEESGTTVPFTDIHATHWALPYLSVMQETGLLTGYNDGTFRPNQTATRAEFISLLDRIVNP